MEDQLWTTLDALGIPNCRLRAFQHTHTALLLYLRATPKVVRRQQRHSYAKTTLAVYGHIVGDPHREAVEKVASILDPSGRISALPN